MYPYICMLRPTSKIYVVEWDDEYRFESVYNSLKEAEEWFFTGGMDYAVFYDIYSGELLSFKNKGDAQTEKVKVYLIDEKSDTMEVKIFKNKFEYEKSILFNNVPVQTQEGTLCVLKIKTAL